jgi:uncharacterized membrane protein
MPRISLLAILTLLIVSLAAAGTASAKPGGPGGARGVKARVTWNTAAVEQTVDPGTTTKVKVTFTSNADLSDVKFKLPGGLGKIVRVEPANFLSVKANQATEVTLTISVPATGARCQGGNLSIRAAGKNVPENLKVRIKVNGGEGCSS